MPFKSKAQQRYLESDSSPLTEEQKREFERDTDFKHLPELHRNRKRRAVKNPFAGKK